MDTPYFSDANLLSPPLKRAAYSDRTAWLMAEMSRLAYHRFEGGKSFESLADDLATVKGEPTKIRKLLKKYLELAGQSDGEAMSFLTDQLSKANFSLVGTYDAGETQGFLAKFEGIERGEPMLVLAFRGTEKKFADFKTDANAGLVAVRDDQKVHQGFYESFQAVKQKIEADLKKHPGVSLYITGHSLGGALAIVATKYLGADSVGACYTFGGPRVGNISFAESIKTPIYRVVNVADAVTRLPPGEVVPVIIAIVKWTPIISGLADYLLRFQGYVHYGDMRYLTHVAKASTDGTTNYPNLKLLANPSMPSRARRFFARTKFPFGLENALTDHALETYCSKLLAYAQRRNK